MRGAHPDAFTAGNAVILMSAFLAASPAVHASVVTDHELRIKAQSLRIVAPSASKRASFHKDRCSHSRSVKDCHLLYVEYYALHPLIPLHQNRGADKVPRPKD